MTKETAFQTLGISEDASPQQIKQAWRDMLAVWHPDKHMGNERLRRKAEEQTKRINEAYDRIKDGNFKSSSQNSHRSYQSERVRTVYVEKEKPIYIKKSSGFSKAFAGLTATGMVISMTMCANRDEHHRQGYAKFQGTISRLEDKNYTLQRLLDETGLDLPKPTESLNERIARWREKKRRDHQQISTIYRTNIVWKTKWNEFYGRPHQPVTDTPNANPSKIPPELEASLKEAREINRAAAEGDEYQSMEDQATDLPDVDEDQTSTGMMIEEYKKHKAMLAATQLKAFLFEEGKTWQEVLRPISIQIQVQKYLDELGLTWQEVEALLHKDAE